MQTSLRNGGMKTPSIFFPVLKLSLFHKVNGTNSTSMMELSVILTDCDVVHSETRSDCNDVIDGLRICQDLVYLGEKKLKSDIYV